MAIRDLMPWTRREPATRRENPFYSLQREMNRLFDGFWEDFGRLPSTEGVAGTFVPSIDVNEEDDKYKVTAEIPGLDEDEIGVIVDNDVLTIEGEKKQEEEKEEEGRKYTERSYGSFRRQIPFDSVNEAEAEASFKNGVLTITLPKAEEVKQKRKKIEIKS